MPGMVLFITSFNSAGVAIASASEQSAKLVALNRKWIVRDKAYKWKNKNKIEISVSTTDVVSTQISVLDTEKRQSESRCRLELNIAIVARLTW